MGQVSQNDASNPNPEHIEALLKIGQLDSGAQDDYKKVLSELSNLSTSLKNIADNPNLYISTGGQDVSDQSFSIVS